MRAIELGDPQSVRPARTAGGDVRSHGWSATLEDPRPQPTRDGAEADAKSLLSVLGLGVSRGHRIAIRAEGDDEEAAIAALRDASRAASASRWTRPRPGETQDPERDRGAPCDATDGGLTGRCSSRACRVRPASRWVRSGGSMRPAPATRTGAGGRRGRRARAVLEPAAQAAASQLEALGAGLRARDAVDEAEILEAQALMAGDPALLDEAVRLAAAGSPPLDALRDGGRGLRRQPRPAR